MANKNMPKPIIFHIREGLDVRIEFVVIFQPIILCPACGQTHIPLETYGGWYCDTAQKYIEIPDFEKLKVEILPGLAKHDASYE